MKRIINFFLVTVLLILTTNSAISSTEVTITGVKQTVVYTYDYDSQNEYYSIRRWSRLLQAIGTLELPTLVHLK
jgi:hypothetical protein